jgi:hypothetical protein
MGGNTPNGTLQHGYALTGHAVQGATVDRAFVLLEGRGALQEWGYVAATRARTETRLYLTKPPLEPDLHSRGAGPEGAVERVSRALERSSTEPLALGQITARPDARVHARRQEGLERLSALALVSNSPRHRGSSGGLAGGTAASDVPSCEPRSPSASGR